MKHRNNIIDVMKGLAILCVMIGHTYWCPRWLYIFIFSFHIPLFFIISGYFAKTREELAMSGGGYIRKSIKQLLIPYAVVACVACLYTSIQAYFYKDASIVTHTMAKYMFAWDTTWEGSVFDKWDGPTWFLLSLFWARLFFGWLSKTGKWFIPLCVALSVTMILLHPYVPTPFGIGRGIQALMFMAIGFAYKRYKIQTWLKIIAVACWPISMLFGNIDMYGYQYNFLPVDILGACGATLVVYYVSKGLTKTFVSPFFTWCGRNSLVILCAHSIEMNMTLIHFATKLLPFKMPMTLFFGMKHGFTLLGAWAYGAVRQKLTAKI